MGLSLLASEDILLCFLCVFLGYMIKWKSKFEFGFFVLYSLRLLHFDFFYVISAARFALLCKLEQSIFITYTIYIYIYVCIICMYMYTYVQNFLALLFEPQCCYDEVRFVSEHEWARDYESKASIHTHALVGALLTNYWILSRLSLSATECWALCYACISVFMSCAFVCVCVRVCLSAWRNEPT